MDEHQEHSAALVAALLAPLPSPCHRIFFPRQHSGMASFSVNMLQAPTENFISKT